MKESPDSKTFRDCYCLKEKLENCICMGNELKKYVRLIFYFINFTIFYLINVFNFLSIFHKIFTLFWYKLFFVQTVLILFFTYAPYNIIAGV